MERGRRTRRKEAACEDQVEERDVRATTILHSQLSATKRKKRLKNQGDTLKLPSNLGRKKGCNSGYLRYILQEGIETMSKYLTRKV